VLLVPDGPLHFVPFEVFAPAAAAPAAAERNRFFADRRYTLDGKDVTYGPSATTLATLSPGDREPGTDLLAVADPAFGTSELAPLPQTRTEVEAISARYRGGEARVLVGADATESALLAPAALRNVRILHLATHGLVDDRRPERSSLALAAPTSPAEDGYLSVPEIYGLELNADLVVLSACETGLGRQVRGEGVLGLPRAFFYAGSPRVVVSLWSVADRSTAELMAGFYGHLVGDGRSAAESLHRAKAELRKEPEFAHPFHWAAFVVMGAPEER
jgi:CHAT domain-containing protein